MRVLLVSASDRKGGAARAAYRLHKGLMKQEGVSSKMVVRAKSSDEPSVRGPSSYGEKIAAKLRPFLAKPILRLQHSPNAILHSINLLPSGWSKTINRSNADVVNLHWIGKEMMSVAEVGRIEKPVVWTLHDMWPFCGAEHYTDPQSEVRYDVGYGRSNRATGHSGIDLDQWVWKRKMRSYADKPITVVTPSQWLGECARSSMVFRDNRIEVIPNGIDTSLYKPMSQKVARKIFNINSEKKLILFGAMDATGDDRKGYSLLKDALVKLPEHVSDHVELGVFGASRGPDTIGKYDVNYLGTLQDDYSLVLAYSAADVFAAPSKQDNLPNTIMEALACGTPCVAFDVGGISDMIDDGKNGYLARAFSAVDFAQGIGWVLSNDERLKSLSRASRHKVEQCFDSEVVSAQYIRLFESLT